MISDNIEEKLSKFVAEITNGRDISHGYDHALSVVKNAKIIMNNMKLNYNQCNWVLIVAWLHDVADHKYDLDGSLMKKVRLFLLTIESDYKIIEYLIKCIEMISFSKEIKNGIRYYEKLLPDEWIVVRNIVSDSDKLEAIGIIGINRSMQYTQEKNNNKLSDKQLFNEIWNNAKDRMLILYKYYITTDYGRILAKPLHIISIEWFKDQGIKPEELVEYLI